MTLFILVITFQFDSELLRIIRGIELHPAGFFWFNNIHSHLLSNSRLFGYNTELQ